MLRSMLVNEIAVVDSSARYEKDPAVKALTFELWFSDAPIELRPLN